MKAQRRTGYSLRDRHKLIALQNYLEHSFPLTIFHVADISDYVKLRFLKAPRKNRKLKESAA